MDIKPKLENACKGFHYTVTEEQLNHYGLQVHRFLKAD